MSPARARRLGSVHRTGIPVSGGLVIGPAHLVESDDAPPVDRPLASGEEAAEVRRFRVAIRRSRDELRALKEVLSSDPDDPGVRVLDAHLLILEDSALEEVLERVRRERRSASVLLGQVFQKHITSLEASDAEYFRARAADIRDVRRRIMRHLEGDSRGGGSSVPVGSILVATELSPSDAASFDPARVRGVVTDHGGATSHAAILARSRGIPAVVGLVNLAPHIREGDTVLVDGDHGDVVVRPTPSEVRSFETRRKLSLRREKALARIDKEPAVTLDAHPISIQANIEIPEDADVVARLHCSGVGLFRTEFFFLGRDQPPDEEGQLRAYRRVVRRLKPDPVTIRTFDLGGDKFASYVGTTRTDNPFLGVRGIRFLLQHRDVLKTQLRAILRASTQGKVRILYPMVTSVEELREANEVREEARRELKREGVRVGPVECGIMIEVPAAVALADLFARECDFFSIGSNDLIQYTLAVDRANQNVAYLYDPFHPAVLRALAATLQAGQRAGIPVSACGEMAGSLHGAAFLLGLGCTQLSMAPKSIRRIKDLVRRVQIVDLRRMTEEALLQSTGADVRRVVEAALRPILGADAAPLMAAPPGKRDGRHEGSG